VKGAEAKGTEPKGVEAGGARIVRSAKRARKSGDDLLTDLFESCSELGFLPDAFAGADFAIDIALESIPCAVVLVSWFDINAREMVVVRQGLTSGEPEKLGNAVLARGSEKLPLIARAMRSGHAQLVSGAALDGIAKDPRWTAIGKPPSSLLVVPIRAGGRYLGLLEAADPLSGKPFGTADADAFTYLGQQFGEFFAEREPSLDPERITRPRLAAAAASRR